MSKNPSWKAVQSGKTRCSPACGYGCTQAAYEKAHRDAKVLLARLRGRGWKIRVWENAGWHYCVHGNGLTVLPCGAYPGKYYAMLSSTDSGGGDAEWTDNNAGPFKDPNRAVRHCLDAAISVVSLKIIAVVRAESAFRSVRKLNATTLFLPDAAKTVTCKE